MNEQNVTAGFNAPASLVQAKISEGKAKTEMPVWKVLLLGIFAGMFIAFGASSSSLAIHAIENPGVAKLIAGLIFPVGLMMIVFVGGELFTGNNLVMAFGAFDKKISWGDAAKVWVVSYIGNFVGCLILSLIFVWAGASGTADYFAGFIGNKLAIPAGQMFFRAVLCNFFVCLGVLCGIKLKSEAAKFLMIVMCISGFVVSGFEHCVANMGIFVTAGCLVPGVSIGAMVKSMIIVTLGNMAGGALLLAWPLRKMSADK